MIENDETLKNMINHSVMEKPLDFQNTFNAAITDRINNSINNTAANTNRKKTSIL